MPTLRGTQQFLFPLMLALLLVGTIPAAQALAQAPDRGVDPGGPTEVTFHLSYLDSNAPVKVVHIMMGDQEVPLDSPVSVSGMWFRKVAVVVQNISPKPVIAATITLLYRETGDGTKARPYANSSISLGRLPSHWYLQKDGTTRPRGPEAQEPEISIAPGASMIFASKAEDADYNQALAVRLAGQITRIEIVFGRFWFSDATIWYSGVFYAPAPAPTLWRKITPAEFFGNSRPPSQP